MKSRSTDPYRRLVRSIQQLAPLAPRTILADPPWRFSNRTGKMAPEHKRLSRYSTLTLDQICDLPVAEAVAERAHLYLWVPNALLNDGLAVLEAWGFKYKSNLVWYKVRKDGGPDRRGVGFYFRNVTEMILFGIRGSNNRTRQPGRTQPNIILSQKREHSRKPEELYSVVEACSHPPFVELFARYSRPGWKCVGDEIDAPRAKRFAAYRGAHESPSLFSRLG